MRLLLLVPILYVTVAETSLVDLRGGAVGQLLALLAVVWLLLAQSVDVLEPARWDVQTCWPGRVGVGLASFLLVSYAMSRLRLRSAWNRWGCN